MITLEISNPKIEKKFTKQELEKIVNDYLENLEKETLCHSCEGRNL